MSHNIVLALSLSFALVFLVPDLIWILHLLVKLTGKLQDGTIFLKKGYNEGEKLFEFKIDEGSRHALVYDILCFCYFVPFCPDVFSLTEQVIKGLDRAVLTMKKGEVSLLSIAPEYAFGSSES